MSRGNPHGALTDQLVTVITKYTPKVRFGIGPCDFDGMETDNIPKSDSRAHRRCRDETLRTLKHHKFGRTNQFAVESSFQGLIERCQIQGNAALADALQERLNRLSVLDYRLGPEVLSLLLQLSDKPVEKSTAESLELLREPEPEPELTWADIIRDDPLDDDDIWSAPDFRSYTSEEDEELTMDGHPASDSSDGTGASSVDNDPSPRLDDVILHPDETSLDQLREQNAWRALVGSSETLRLTELQVLREALHMLLGRPSAIFDKTKRARRIVPVYGAMLEQTSLDSIYHVSSYFAEVGNALTTLRAFASRPRSSRLLETFAAEIEKQTREFDSFICSEEHSLVLLQEPVLVSLLSLHEKVRNRSRALLRLHDLVRDKQLHFENTPFRLLDFLFETSCEVHSIGDSLGFTALARILDSCLVTYLAPLLSWMTQGTLEDVDEDLIAETRADGSSATSISTFWRSRFSIRCTEDGNAQAPALLLPFIPAIFSSGKSVAFLRELGLSRLLPASGEGLTTFLASSLADASDTVDMLIPFSLILHERLSSIVTSNHLATSSILSSHLLNRLHLRATLEALQTIYLSATGSLHVAFADSLFARLASPHPPTRYIIAELARSAFSSHPAVDVHLLSSTITSPLPESPLSSTKPLTLIHILHAIPPALQNIIHPRQLLSYINILTLLLQIRLPLTLLTSPSLLHTITTLASPHHTRLSLFLRHRLLWLLTTLLDHLLHTVIAAASRTLTAALDAARDVDALVAAHAAFTRRIRLGTLHDPVADPARRTVDALLDIAVAFVRAVNKMPLRAAVAPAPALHVELRQRQMRGQLADLSGMLVAQLRSAARGPGGAETGWDVLAERLEWGGR